MKSKSQSVAEQIVQNAHNPPTMTDLELEIWKGRRDADAARHCQIFLLENWLASHPLKNQPKEQI